MNKSLQNCLFVYLFVVFVCLFVCCFSLSTDNETGNGNEDEGSREDLQGQGSQKSPFSLFVSFLLCLVFLRFCCVCLCLGLGFCLLCFLFCCFLCFLFACWGPGGTRR